MPGAPVRIAALLATLAAELSLPAPARALDLEHAIAEALAVGSDPSTRRAASGFATHERLGEVWAAYADAFFARELVREGDHQRTLMERMVRTARAGYATLRSGHHEMTRAEAERARMLAELEEYRGEERSARARLAALIGRDRLAPGEPLQPPPLPAVPEEPATWLTALAPEPSRPRAPAAEAADRGFAARAEIAAAHAMALSAQRAHRLRSDTVGVAQDRWLESAWNAYSTGTASLGEVLAAAHAVRVERIAVLRARQRLSRAQARLVALTGRTDLLGVRLPPNERGQP